MHTPGVFGISVMYLTSVFDSMALTFMTVGGVLNAGGSAKSSSWSQCVPVDGRLSGCQHNYKTVWSLIYLGMTMLCDAKQCFMFNKAAGMPMS